MLDKSKHGPALSPASCLAVAACLMLPACTTRMTTLGPSWTDPDHTRARLRKVLVIGVAEHKERRSAFENQFVSAFRLKGVDSVASHTLLPDFEELKRPAIEAAIEGQGFDSVIVTRLVGIDVKYERSPGGYYVLPDNYYNSLYGYYHQSWVVAQAPDDVTAKQTVSLETNLYETESARLVWSVQSKNFKKKSTFDVIQTLTRTLVDRLARDGFL